MAFPDDTHLTFGPSTSGNQRTDPFPVKSIYTVLTRMSNALAALVTQGDQQKHLNPESDKKKTASENVVC